MKKAAKRAAGLHCASLTKLHDLDAALELMYYGSLGMTLTADEYLATLGLSRPHHRILYVVARHPWRRLLDRRLPRASGLSSDHDSLVAGRILPSPPFNQ